MIREISLYSNNSRLTDIHPLEKLSLTIISLIIYIVYRFLSVYEIFINAHIIKAATHLL